MIGWVATVGSNRSKLAGFSIAKYGPQAGNDWQWFADAGNGVRTNGQYVTGNDPRDANVPSTSLSQQAWVQHLVGRWGTNAAGGLRYYILDNEPSLWHSTHRDVHPSGATMDEIRDKTIDYGAKIKAIDETWINDRVQLVPRLKSWVNGHYPGTQTGITEYNWGAENHINGATAQADILGIFGREGLDVAARWATPASTTPTYKAIKMYRNYDGNRSTFGETSVAATAPNPDAVAAFAALRSSDGALTVMMIGKSSGSTPAVISMANFVPGGAARAWLLTAANTIARLPDVAVAGSALAVTLPPQSITLLVVPPGGQLTAPTGLRVIR
jgi:hypothetical protein